MTIFGDYCGPYWSDGKVQTSVAGYATARSALDQICKDHDREYFEGGDLERADAKFYRRAMRLGYPHSVIMGLMVGLQGKMRAAGILKKTMPLYEYTVGKWGGVTSTNPTKNTPKMRTTREIRPVQPPKGEPPRGTGDVGTAPPSVPAPTPGKEVVVYQPPPGINEKIIYMPNMTKSKKKSKPSSGQLVKQFAYATAITSKVRKPKPRSRGGVVVLSHRGLIGAFMGSTTFTASNYAVNPGMASVFPWASQLARSYDKYRFKRLKFEYRAVVPTTTAGVTMMSFDYDILDALPVTKGEHAATFPNAESNSFNSFELEVKCDDQWRFVRQGAISGADLKTYDLGQLVVSSSYAAAALMGELYVDYEVELDKPSKGSPICMKVVTTASTVVEPFQSATLTGVAQPFELATTAQLRCLRTGEYQFTIKVAGTGIANIVAPTFVSTAQAGSAIKIRQAQVFDAGQAAGICIVAARIAAGEIMNWASYQNATTTPTATWFIEETDYSL